MWVMYSVLCVLSLITGLFTMEGGGGNIYMIVFTARLGYILKILKNHPTLRIQCTVHTLKISFIFFYFLSASLLALCFRNILIDNE